MDRVVSWYYYHRSPWHLVKHDAAKNRTILKDRLPPLEHLKTQWEDCVAERKPECVYEAGNGVHSSQYGGSHVSQIAFYCGMGDECDVFESRAALETAKANVERWFGVVGVLEEMEKSLAVFEAYIPRYFAGVKPVYDKMMAEKTINENIYKPRTSKRVKRSLYGNFSVEIEFYEWCKQRLQRQFLAITN